MHSLNWAQPEQERTRIGRDAPGWLPQNTHPQESTVSPGRAGVGQATIASMHATGVMHPAGVKSEESGNFGIGTNRPDNGSSVTSTLQRLVKVIELGRDHGSPQLASSGTRGVPAQWRSKAPSRRRFRGRAPGYRRDVANSG
jgi:hypothetical protein